MASRSISKPFPGFSSVYLLSSGGSGRGFRADVELATREEAFGITRAEITLPHPVEARWAMGRRKPGDIIWTTFAAPLLVSERVITVLQDKGFTGWRTYDVKLRGHDGTAIPGYHGLSIYGRCGSIDESKAVQAMQEFPGGVFPVWLGMYFDPVTWDGSDFFMPDIYVGAKLVTEEVKRAFEKAKIKNVEFTSLVECEVFPEKPQQS